MYKKLKCALDDLIPLIIDIRKAIHSNPELELNTNNTREIIKSNLERTFLKIWQPLIQTDLIAELHGNTNRTICLRADTDALPIDETSTLSYKSKSRGVMHACGHDGHTAILIGTALLLNRFQEYLPSTIRFIFQPGEEIVCAGKTLVDLGALDNVDEVYALHGWPGLPVGNIATTSGPIFAAGITFSIKLKGKGCHGAMPEKGENPIIYGAEVIRQLQKLHEKMNLENNSVISVCSVNAGHSGNVIPDIIIIKGTARYLNHEIADRIKDKIDYIIKNVIKDTLIKVDIEYESLYSYPVINHSGSFDKVRRLAQHYIPEKWNEIKKPFMVNEDFAFYLTKCPGLMFLLGLGEDSPNLHSANFDFNDNAIRNGILMFSLIALNK